MLLTHNKVASGCEKTPPSGSLTTPSGPDRASRCRSGFLINAGEFHSDSIPLETSVGTMKTTFSPKVAQTPVCAKRASVRANATAHKLNTKRSEEVRFCNSTARVSHPCPFRAWAAWETECQS